MIILFVSMTLIGMIGSTKDNVNQLQNDVDDLRDDVENIR